MLYIIVPRHAPTGGELFSKSTAGSITPAASLATSVGGQTEVIEIQLSREKGSNGAGLASFGLPLPPGYLQPSESNLVSLWIAGVEQQIYIEILAGRHSDGSVRSVYIQCNVTISSGSPINAEVRIGPTRNTTDLTKTAFSSITGFESTHPGTFASLSTYGYPNVIGVPTSISYLASCQLVRPMNTAAYDTALGGRAATLISGFETTSNNYWNGGGAYQGYVSSAQSNYGNVSDYVYFTNYYDRCYNHYLHWLRTGNKTYYVRACAYGRNWGKLYVQPAGFGVQPHNAYTEGQLLHYWLTGCPDSLDVVRNIPNQWIGIDAWDGDHCWIGGAYTDPRVSGLVPHAILTAWRSGLVTFPSGSRNVASWLEQQANRTKGSGVKNNAPNYSEVAHLMGVWNNGTPDPNHDKVNVFTQTFPLEFLIQYHTWYTTVSDLNTYLKDAFDWLYDSVQTLVGGGTGVSYVANAGYSGVGGAYRYTYASGEGNSNPTHDLNGLFVGFEGYYAGATGNSTYINRGDDIRLGIEPVLNTDSLSYPAYQKVFNQTYRYVARYTKDRNL